MTKTTSNKLSRRWRKPAAFLAALGAMLATFMLASTAAMASIPGGLAGGPKSRETFSKQVIIVPGGMPGWEIALIAAGTAVVAAVLAVLACRFWTARRPAAPQQPTAVRQQPHIPA